MALRVEHELHRRRASRNLGLLVVLALFAALVFGLTIAKVESGDSMKAWDHHLDNALLPQNNGAPSPAAPSAPGASAAPPAPAALQPPAAPPAPPAPAASAPETPAAAAIPVPAQ